MASIRLIPAPCIRSDTGCSIKSRATSGAPSQTCCEDAGKRQKIDKKRYVNGEVGLPTLNDIIAELAKPGRDPRQQFEAFSFTEGIEKMEDLKPGIRLPGIVTNVTAFGAFVDIGVHQDGLVHVSQLSDSFVKNAADVVKVGQRVMATVMEIDLPRKRIALSLKSKPEMAPRGERNGGARNEGNPRDVRRFAGSASAPGSPARNSAPAAPDWFTLAQQKKK